MIDETLTHHRIVSAPSPILEKNQVITLYCIPAHSQVYILHSIVDKKQQNFGEEGDMHRLAVKLSLDTLFAET